MEIAEQTTINEEGAHRKFAADCFNQIWTLLEKPERTNEENELMIHLAHASLYHWLQVGTPLNEQRGEWMLARVYTILKDKVRALHYAERCLYLTEKHDIDDFDLAYAYEAMARANALNKVTNSFQKYFELAKQTADQIRDADDKELLLKDLEEEPWFGMK